MIPDIHQVCPLLEIKRTFHKHVTPFPKESVEFPISDGRMGKYYQILIQCGAKSKER